MAITMTSFGSNGRLGNQLFQYASMIGLAKKHKTELVLPEWKYAQYFEGTFPSGGVLENARAVREPVFNYIPDWPYIAENDQVDIKGYLQSEKYWEDAIEEVRTALTFKKEFKEQVWNNFMINYVDEDFKANPKKTLAISVRRGDYVGNPHYAQLLVTYYIRAMFDNFPDWRDRNIILFSDDIPWCRVHFDCLPNTYFSENNSDIEDLCLMSQCDDFIISNSTFGWWGAYLGQQPIVVDIAQIPEGSTIEGFIALAIFNCTTTKVIRPVHHFAGKLLKQNNIKDFYPARWIAYDHKDEIGQNKRLDLKDCCFTIPVRADHEDRVENLKLIIRYLLENLDTDIMVQEQGGTTFNFVGDDWRVKYLTFGGHDFHRTRMLNYMAAHTNKPYIFNWDADVLITPLQLWLTAEKLRAGADMVYPYDGQFARAPRNTWFVKLRDHDGDVGIFGDTKLNGMNRGDAVSLGGAVAWNKKKFFELGGENEQFVAYCPEDMERYERAVKLGAIIDRVPGPMYHINHFVGPTSNMSNPHYPAGKRELERIRALPADILYTEVKTWPKGL